MEGEEERGREGGMERGRYGDREEGKGELMQLLLYIDRKSVV